MAKPALFQQAREKEKLELSSLNDKFADYVEKVRYLEAQNKKVQMETNILDEKQRDNCQRTKSTFETEVAQLKDAVEKLFKEKNTIAYAAKDAQVRTRASKTSSTSKLNLVYICCFDTVATRIKAALFSSIEY